MLFSIGLKYTNDTALKTNEVDVLAKCDELSKNAEFTATQMRIAIYCQMLRISRSIAKWLNHYDHDLQICGACVVATLFVIIFGVFIYSSFQIDVLPNLMVPAPTIMQSDGALIPDNTRLVNITPANPSDPLAPDLLTGHVIRHKGLLCERMHEQLCDLEMRVCSGKATYTSPSGYSKTKKIYPLFNLTNAAFSEELPVIDLSYNCSGSLIAVAFGQNNHSTLCNHKGAICTYEFDQSKSDNEKLNVTIDYPCCLSSISFHPVQPYLLAAGSLSGQVVVWNISDEENTQFVFSSTGDRMHKRPVAKLQWIVNRNSQDIKYNLVSVGLDGMLIIWQLDPNQQSLKGSNVFTLCSNCRPNATMPKGHACQPVELSRIAFDERDETLFVVGTESGGVFRCSTRTRKATAWCIQSSVPLDPIVSFIFSRHEGPVRAVELSPFNHRLFLSCSTDGSIRISSIREREPLLSIKPNAGPLIAASWSPIRPPVLAVGTGNGRLLLFDLKKNRSSPVIAHGSTNSEPICCLKFNCKRNRLLATGHGNGCTTIWRLPDELTEQRHDDEKALDEITIKKNLG